MMRKQMQSVPARRRSVASRFALFAAAAMMSPATIQQAQAKETNTSIGEVAAFLAGRYDNAAQVDREKSQHPPSQHVTITIEPTPEADWQIWHVHMDVEPEVAKDAGSDTSLDAVWAMNITKTPRGIEIVPYTSKPSVDADALQASSFDETRWLSLSACALAVDFSKSKLIASAPPDEMCVAATMGLGGKRAFLPTWVSREGDRFQAQLMYFGKPWELDARRTQ